MKLKIKLPSSEKMLEKLKEIFGQFQWKISFLMTVAVLFIYVNEVFKQMAWAQIPFTLILIILWLLADWLFHFEGRVSVIFGIFLLASLPFVLSSGKEDLAEQLAVAAYIFLALGVLQQFIGLLTSKTDDDDGF